MTDGSLMPQTKDVRQGSHPANATQVSTSQIPSHSPPESLGERAEDFLRAVLRYDGRPVASDISALSALTRVPPLLIERWFDWHTRVQHIPVVAAGSIDANASPTVPGSSVVKSAAPEDDGLPHTSQDTCFPSQAIRDAIEGYRRDAELKCRKGRKKQKSPSGIYFCTSKCGFRTTRPDDWKKHEEINQPQEFWACKFCHTEQKGPHIDHRKDKLKDHMKAAHTCDSKREDFDTFIESCKVPTTAVFNGKCIFCEYVASTWKERCLHIANHFKDKRSIGGWHYSSPGDDPPGPGAPPAPPPGAPGPASESSGKGYGSSNWSSSIGRPNGSIGGNSHYGGNSHGTHRWRRGADTDGSQPNMKQQSTSKYPAQIHFSFQALPSRTSYRLLRLLPGQYEADIEGRLIITDLNDQHYEYEALSHHGVEATATSYNGRSLHLSPSLVDILRKLRLADMPRILWVDTICINQCDEQEKIQQHRIAHDIVERSSNVLFWSAHSDAASSVASSIASNWQRSPSPDTSVSSTSSRRSSDSGSPFEKISDLGQGAYGLVHKVKLQERHHEASEPTVFALKTVHNYPNNIKIKRQFLREVSIVGQLQHHSIVPFVAAYSEFDSLNLVMSSVAECNLKEYLEKPAASGSAQHLLAWIGDLASAVQYLHSKHIRHADLKPANLLISGSKILIADFGVSRFLSKTEPTTASRSPMTPLYAAPEVAEGRAHGRPADVFSLGLIFLEICAVLLGLSVRTLQIRLGLRSGQPTRQQQHPKPENARRAIQCEPSSGGANVNRGSPDLVPTSGRPAPQSGYSRTIAAPSRHDMLGKGSRSPAAGASPQPMYWKHLPQIVEFIDSVRYYVDGPGPASPDRKGPEWWSKSDITASVLRAVAEMLNSEAGARPTAEQITSRIHAMYISSQAYLRPNSTDLYLTCEARHSSKPMTTPSSTDLILDRLEFKLSVRLSVSTENSQEYPRDDRSRSKSFSGVLSLLHQAVTLSQRPKKYDGSQSILHQSPSKSLSPEQYAVSPTVQALYACIMSIVVLSIRAPDSIANAPAPVLDLWFDVVAIAQLLHSILIAFHQTRPWTLKLEMERGFQVSLRACMSTFQGLLGLIKQLALLRSKYHQDVRSAVTNYTDIVTLKDQLSAHHERILSFIQKSTAWFPKDGGRSTDDQSRERLLLPYRQRRKRSKSKPVNISELDDLKSEEQNGIHECSCACRKRQETDLIGLLPSSTEDKLPVSRSTGWAPAKDSCLSTVRGASRETVFERVMCENVPADPRERFLLERTAPAERILHDEVRGYEDRWWDATDIVQVTPPAYSQSRRSSSTKRRKTESSSIDSIQNPSSRRDSGYEECVRRRSSSALRNRSRKGSPLAIAASNLRAIVDNPQSGQLQAFVKPELERRPSWEDTRSNKSNKSGYQRYGRHANQWLFGDFSFRAIAKEAWRKWM